MSHPNRLLHVNLLATFFLALCCHVASIATAHEFAAGEKVLVIRNTSLLSTQENTSPETDVPRGHVFTVKQVRGQEIQCDEKYFGWLSTSDVILGDKAAIEKLTQLIQEEPNNVTLYLGRVHLRSESESEINNILLDLDQVIKLQPTADNYCVRAGASASNQNYDRALEDCEEVRKLDPNYPDLSMMIAGVLCYSGAYEKCIRHCDAILQNNPSDQNVRKLRATSYLMREEYDKSLADINFLIQAYPTNLGYCRERALLLMAMKRFEEALAESNYLLDKEPSNPENHLTKAKSYLAQGDEEKALIDLCAGLSLDPKHQETLALRADLLEHRNNYTAALKDASKLVELYPADPKAFLRRATISQNMGASPEVILRDLHEAVRVAPTNIEAYEFRASFHLKQGNYDASCEDYATIIRLDSTNAKAYETLGCVEFYRNNLDRAHGSISRSLELNPNSANAWFLLAMSLVYKNENQQAIPYFDRAIDLAPNVIRYYLERGFSHNTLNNSDLAIRDFTHVIDNSTDCVSAFGKRGGIYLLNKQYALALADFNGALEIEPQNGDILKGRGIALYFLRSFKRALEDLTTSLQLQPKDAYTAYIRGDCYVQLGDLDSARRDYEKCIEWSPDGNPATWAKANLAKLDKELKRELDITIIAANYTKPLPVKKEETLSAALLHLQGLKKLNDNDLVGAAGDFEAALKLEPTRLETLKWFGELRIMQKDYDRALVIYSQIIDADPHQAFAYHQRAKVYGALKEYGKANADEAKAAELDPTISIVHYDAQEPDFEKLHTEGAFTFQPLYGVANASSIDKGRAKLMLGQFDDAITHFDAAIAEDPQSADAFYHRGLAHAELHQTEQALADMQQAETFANDDKNILNGIAWFYATAKDANCRRSAKAIEIATKLCELSDWKEGRYLGTLAAAHAEAGDFAAAVTRQKDALVNYTAEDRQAFEYLLAVYESGKPYRESEMATVPKEDLDTQTPMYQSSPAEGE